MKRYRGDWAGTLLFAGIVALIAVIAWGILTTVRSADGAERQRGEVEVIKLVKGDVDLLGRVIWAEARSEEFNGQCAIAWVILNRLSREPGRFPKTLQGIIKQPYAFSCFNSNDPQCERVKVIDERDATFVEALHAATAVLTGRVASPIGNADHYYVTAMARPPAWARKMTLVKKIGAHSFFSENP